MYWHSNGVAFAGVMPPEAVMAVALPNVPVFVRNWEMNVAHDVS
jgi:hypothetical protein